MRRPCGKHHLPAVEFHPIVEGYEVDFRVVGTPVLLECDGGNSTTNVVTASSATVDATPSSWPPATS